MPRGSRRRQVNREKEGEEIIFPPHCDNEMEAANGSVKASTVEPCPVLYKNEAKAPHIRSLRLNITVAQPPAQPA